MRSAFGNSLFLLVLGLGLLLHGCVKEGTMCMPVNITNGRILKTVASNHPKVLCEPGYEYLGPVMRCFLDICQRRHNCSVALMSCEDCKCDPPRRKCLVKVNITNSSSSNTSSTHDRLLMSRARHISGAVNSNRFWAHGGSPAGGTHWEVGSKPLNFSNLSCTWTGKNLPTPKPTISVASTVATTSLPPTTTSPATLLVKTAVAATTGPTATTAASLALPSWAHTTAQRQPPRQVPQAALTSVSLAANATAPPSAKVA